ncbi:hypothetical protein HKD37_07G018257 [Glycine soja]
MTTTTTMRVAQRESFWGVSSLNKGRRAYIADIVSFVKKRNLRENQRKKMIYRKWSLLTGPVTILGGVVVAIAAANVIFVKNAKQGTIEFIVTTKLYSTRILSSNQRRGSMKMNLLPSRRKETTEVCVLMSFKP